ncbi:MAG TPA: bifunctional 2-polyprenyl-6-hydroxyphenol methylase/3-demethylubiquinol 3-O-methyltransferase UbiG [Afifellaceae bacterium]|nr:bifunctional 2-polyprenyl-6-hydroxyphenol methylase/3-demethylubiquinol 3-O-methyltransferase UbiG [Afifellaceae bacterium]
MAERSGTVDRQEVEKFARLAAEWWDPDGPLKPLHRLNPVRLGYVRDQVCSRFGREATTPKPFTGLRILDIGCGAGLLTEPMARLGAEVVGADPAEANIAVARLHGERAGLAIDYRATTAEALAESGESFDAILAMEVVEHVADLPAFLRASAAMLRPEGLMLLATINRTAKAFALAIVAAEYVLGWLPRGTHSYDRLIQPQELERALALAGLAVTDRAGVSYHPLPDRWQRSRDLDVNYMVSAERSRIQA